MGRIKYNNEDIALSLREALGQSTESSENEPKKKNKSGSRKAGSAYDSFLRKYHDLENGIKSFGTKDLLFYFREKSRESGNNYVIANMQRDMGIFKKLQESYTIEEILLMIEFIFSGEQTYLDTTRTQPTVLASNWVNTIYPDSKLWANDEYIDKKSIYKKKTTREWESSNTNSTKIGEWE